MSEESRKQNTELPEIYSEMMGNYVKTQEIDIKSILPSQRDTGIRLEERQETTRSQLATFLIRMLAGTLIASFSIIAILTVTTSLVDDKKAEIIKENNLLVKDLITLILTAQTGLIGTALGFYFGSRSGKSD
jgi:hypothetical protein